MNSDFLECLAALLAEEARFLVVGAHALAVHGVPRATGDIDIWIDRTPANVARVVRALVRERTCPTRHPRTNDAW